MAVVAKVAGGDVEEVEILEGSLEDMVVDSLVVIEDLVVEDRANVHQPAALGLYRGVAANIEVIEDLVVEDRANIHQPAALGLYRGVGANIEVVSAGDLVEVTLRDITMEDTIIPEDIMEGIADTIIEDMPPMEQPSGFFLVG